MPDRQSGYANPRRRRTFAKTHGEPRTRRRFQKDVRADDAYRALVPEARLRTGNRGRSAEGSPAHVQLAAQIAGLYQETIIFARCILNVDDEHMQRYRFNTSRNVAP